MNTGYMLSGTSPYGVGNGGGGSDAYGLGALPGATFAVEEGKLSIGGPTIPLIAAVGGALALSSRMGGWGWLVGGVGGYFIARLAVIGAKGMNVSQNI